jgi:hypothetical protein
MHVLIRFAQMRDVFVCNLSWLLSKFSMVIYTTCIVNSLPTLLQTPSRPSNHCLSVSMKTFK